MSQFEEATLFSPVLHRGEFEELHVLQAAKMVWLWYCSCFCPDGLWHVLIPLCFRPVTPCKGKYWCFWFVFSSSWSRWTTNLRWSTSLKAGIPHLLGFLTDSGPLVCLVTLSTNNKKKKRMSRIPLLMWSLIRKLILSADSKNVGQITFLEHSQPVKQNKT